MSFFFKDVYDLEGKGFSIRFAERQYRYERGQIALRMHQSGFTHQEIGDKFGVTLERSRQMCKHAERENERGYMGPLGSVLDDMGSKTQTFDISNPGWIDEETRGRLLKKREERRAGAAQRTLPIAASVTIDPGKLAHYRRQYPHFFDGDF